MDRFLAEVERSAFRIAEIAVRDADDALDIVQDSMIALVQRYADKPGDQWRPLFFRILKNRIVDHQRRRAVRNRVIAWFSRSDRDDGDEAHNIDAVAALPDQATPGPDKRLSLDAALQALERAIGALPARQQQAVLLRLVEGSSVAETATVMGCTEGSVKTHYSRAIHRLREALGDDWS